MKLTLLLSDRLATLHAIAPTAKIAKCRLHRLLIRASLSRFLLHVGVKCKRMRRQIRIRKRISVPRWLHALSRHEAVFVRSLFRCVRRSRPRSVRGVRANFVPCISFCHSHMSAIRCKHHPYAPPAACAEHGFQAHASPSCSLRTSMHSLTCFLSWCA